MVLHCYTRNVTGIYSVYSEQCTAANILTDSLSQQSDHTQEWMVNGSRLWELEFRAERTHLIYCKSLSPRKDVKGQESILGAAC